MNILDDMVAKKRGLWGPGGRVDLVGKENQLENVDQIHPGQELTIEGKPVTVKPGDTLGQLILDSSKAKDAGDALDNIAGGNLADPYLAKMLAAAALEKEKKPEKTINKKEEERAAAFERSRKLKRMMSNLSRPKPLALFDTDLI